MSQNNHCSAKMKLAVLCLIITMLAPILAFSESGHQRTEADKHLIAMGDQLRTILAFSKDNAYCCIDMHKRSGIKRQNRFRQLIEHLHAYVYEENKGWIRRGDQSLDIEIESYYDADISIPEIYGQLLEAGFSYTSASLDSECLKMISAPEETLCENTELCNKCPFSLYFSYHDNKRIFTFGYPIYFVTVLCDAGNIKLVDLRINMRK